MRIRIDFKSTRSLWARVLSFPFWVMAMLVSTVVMLAVWIVTMPLVLITQAILKVDDRLQAAAALREQQNKWRHRSWDEKMDDYEKSLRKRKW